MVLAEILANVKWCLTDVAWISLLVLTAVLAVSLFSTFYHQLSLRWFSEKCLADFPGDSAHWLLGHFDRLDPTEKGISIGLGWTAKYKYGFPLWMGPFRGTYECVHPITVKAILSTAEPKDEFFYGFLKPWLGDGLLISTGQKWTRNRKLLTPGFHFEILKPYAKIFSECSHVLVDKWASQCEEGPLEMFSHISLTTLDCLMKCIFGLDVQCQTNKETHPYIQDVYEISSLTVKRVFNVLHHSDLIYRLSANGRKYFRAVNSLHGQSKAVIESRRRAFERKDVEKRKYIDFLDILLAAKDEDGNGLTDQEIQDEVDTFMFEGHDTTASGISWCLYNLAKNPEHQRKCQEEIDEFFATKGCTDLEWDDMNSFPYLTLCIKESLRITPPVPVINRKINKRVDLPDGRALLPGLTVSINIYFLHHNPHVWDDPEVFDPSRFLPENVQKRSPHAFVPFSAGPRNCIGQNFAMIEMKITIATLLHQFDFTLVEDKPPKPIFGLVYRAIDGLYLHVKKRQPTKIPSVF